MGSESGFGSKKVELEDEQAEAQWALLQDTWTPQTLQKTASEVGAQYSRLAEENQHFRMAREAERTSLEKIMELIVTMKMEDQKREQEREERRDREARERADQRERERIEQREKERENLERIEREEKWEEERERREARLLTTLKEAQPAVPQHVNIKKLELSKMRDKDDPETFIKYLEVALTRSKIPREEWKDYVQPQLTLEAGEKILGVLQNKDLA